MKAQNYVGIIETKSGTVLEILPKIDFSTGEAMTKEIFLQMLRTWRSFKSIAQHSQSSIGTLAKYSMLEFFYRIFLDNLVALTKRGIARSYQEVEDNLPYLKGRLNFTKHIATNITNQAKFYVTYDDFNANRPANRLIQSTIHKLLATAKQFGNIQLLNQLKLIFDEIPLSKNWRADWQKHQVDRSMQHYKPVMEWVGLFLFNEGLTTFKGKHVSQCLLFPMEKIFEDYVAHSFRKEQDKYLVKAQAQAKHLAIDEARKRKFALRPDILLQNKNNELPVAILDTKWKRINDDTNPSDLKSDISQSDMYQMYAYAKKYRCSKLMLIYPKNEYFTEPFHYYLGDDKQFKDIHLTCFPFDVADTAQSVKAITELLANNATP